jgi:plastocyanin
MRFYGLAIAASALLLGACSSGENKAADSAAMAAPAAATPTDSAATAAATPAATPAGAMAPITGTTHEVKMIGDDKGYRFEPADIKIKAGDGIKWTVVSGPPHNVAFTDVPAAAKSAMMANMPEQMGELSSKMLMAAGESYTMSFAGVAPGKYNYNCTPHLAMNMKGTVTVE